MLAVLVGLLCGGAVQMMVPSSSWWSVQPPGPVQKVLSRWCLLIDQLLFGESRCYLGVLAEYTSALAYSAFWHNGITELGTELGAELCS